jgi:anaerobic selenocysteine-containing dehydrogenase
VLQWRYQAVSPLGNSKTDMELLLRFAKALDGANAFAHIKSVWNTLGVLGGNSADAWAMLYGNQYGWTWGGTFNSEAVASKVYKQMCAPQNFGGTIWIYLDAWDVTTAISQSWSPTAGTPTVTLGGANLPPTVLNGATPVTDWTFNNNTAILTAGASLYGLTLTVNWDKFSSANARGAEWPSTIVISGVSAAYDGNRAKSRVKVDAGAGGVGSGNLLYKNWGYSWLVNRRVFYNNSDVPGDQADGFQGPELVSRMYTSTSTATIDYSTAYRTIHRLTDVPKLPGNTTPAQAPMAGRFPHHTEPYETPREDLAAYWGYNTVSNTALTPGAAATGERNLVPIDTPIGTKATYPLVLTTIRCVEHFQGGPITRNNWANVDLEPVPWVELNSTDARAAGIKDGDPVRIVTARTESFGANHTIEQSFPRALYGQGFVARVGTGLPAGQKIGAGVVAIPWHWGEAGLATGSRANDLCIDAMDANTTIPESKACLCRIEKM